MFLKKNSSQKALQEIYDELKHTVRQDEMPRRIELCRRALTMVSKETEPELWAKLQDDLASSLARNPMGVRAENLEQAISHYQLALKVRTRQEYPGEWASTQNNLANTYRDRIRGERAENVEKAIQYYQEALEVRTQELDPEHWAMTQANLAGAYLKRIRGNRAENLELAIQCSQQALGVFTRHTFPQFWMQAKNSLGEACRVRIYGSRTENIELAIQHFQQTLDEHTRDVLPGDWAMIQNSLGNAYLVRIRGSQAENMEQAIHYFEQSLEVRTRQADPERWAMAQYNLGNAYRYRIRGDQAENIEQAIHHFEQALEVRTRDAYPEDWAQTQNNLGIAYLSRIRGEPAKNIEQAIDYFEQSLEARTREALSADWAETHNNLGNACLVRIEGKRTENVELAIHHFEQALEVRTRAAYPEEWAQTLNNLAGAERMHASGVIEQAIQHLKQALEVRTREAYPEDWAQTHNNLAIAYTDRTQGEHAENMEHAIQHYQQALEVYTQMAFPDRCIKVARALGNLAFEEQQWKLARESYDSAFGAQDILMQASFSRAVKQIELGEVQNLRPRAAYACVQLGDLKRAVEVLEQGRAQLLRESLERRRRDLEQLPAIGFGNLYEDYMLALHRYNDIQSTGTVAGARSEDWLSRMDQALKKVQAAESAIREKAGESHPQYQYFLEALPFDEIQKQAREKPIVYLSATSAGGIAVIVSGLHVQAIRLPELNQKSLQAQIWRPTDEEIDRINDHLKKGRITEEDIQAVRGGYFSMYALWSMVPYLTGTSRDLMHRLFAAWRETLEETTHWLWDAFMGTLVSALKEFGSSATLIPSGQLALLPLHAAWTEDAARSSPRQYALDEINFTYAPSSHALWQAGLAADRPAEILMAVDNPDGTLHFSEGEVQAALGLFEHGVLLRGVDATIGAVKKEMQTAHVLHFSTHGNAGWEKEDEARLKLADGYLTLPDIFELHLDQARLAVLSACETGVPGLKLIDELIGLPAGMMQAGVPGVVGSLWSVNDMSTSMLMARFYIHWREEGCAPQEALRQAQVWLRDSSIGQKMDFFKSFAGKRSVLSARAAASFYFHLGLMAAGEVDFSSPYYWAAFTYTGV
jgi:tetratricopeptide (TPR) repeat protein